VANEVTVTEECAVADYAAYTAALLEDAALLFDTVRSAAAAQVPRVLAVVEEAKRIRHKQGIADDSLHQYVVYDAAPRAPARINLDDAPPPRAYTPPDSLAVHLSKIDMPELKPRPSPRANTQPRGAHGASPPPPSPEYAPVAERAPLLRLLRRSTHASLRDAPAPASASASAPPAQAVGGGGFWRR